MISATIIELIEKGNDMLPFSPSDDCRKKASKFLAIWSAINEERFQIDLTLIQLSSIEKATFAKVFANSFYKTVQEKNIHTEADPEYLEAKEKVAEAKNAILYLVTQAELFKNAHLFYRQQLKDKESMNG